MLYFCNFILFILIFGFQVLKVAADIPRHVTLDLNDLHGPNGVNGTLKMSNGKHSIFSRVRVQSTIECSLFNLGVNQVHSYSKRIEITCVMWVFGFLT